jgi:membrane associated rhomboid family serine protease
VYSNRMFLPLTPVVKNLLIINTLIFLAQKTFEHTVPIDALFAQHHFLSKDFRPHQLITAMFMHANFGHLFGNMLGLYVFGTKLEMVWGGKRFLTYYIVCGLGAGVIIGLATLIETYPMIRDLNLVMQQASVENFNMLYSKYDLSGILNPQLQGYLNANSNTAEASRLITEVALNLKERATSGTVIGASGALFGLIAGAGYLFPNDMVYYGFFIPIKMKWLALGYSAFELFAAIQNAPGDQVAHVAHLGGALVGFLILFFSYRRGNRRKLF